MEGKPLDKRKQTQMLAAILILAMIFVILLPYAMRAVSGGGQGPSAEGCAKVGGVWDDAQQSCALK